MPEFILPAEADHCPDCGAVLRYPPDCCAAARAADALLPDTAPDMEAELWEAAMEFGEGMAAPWSPMPTDPSRPWLLPPFLPSPSGNPAVLFTAWQHWFTATIDARLQSPILPGWTVGQQEWLYEAMRDEGGEVADAT